jgi:hypothetical protein
MNLKLLRSNNTLSYGKYQWVPQVKRENSQTLQILATPIMGSWQGHQFVTYWVNI